MVCAKCGIKVNCFLNKLHGYWLLRIICTPFYELFYRYTALCDIVTLLLVSNICYLPPEMVSGNSFDKSVDIWSVGVLLYEFLVGEPPFLGSTYNETYTKILVARLYFPRHVTPLAQDLISSVSNCCNCFLS